MRSFRIVLKHFLELPNLIYHFALFKVQGVDACRGFRVRGRLYIRNMGNLRIGRDVRINSSGVANPIGGGERCYIQVLKGATLIIGSNVGISNTAITCAENIEIGDNVLVGAGCRIYDTDFHPLAPRARVDGDTKLIRHAPVRIERDAFLGAGCYVLKGTTVGEGSVIGAGSVVTRDVPSFEIWAGNPATFVRRLTAEERQA